MRVLGVELRRAHPPAPIEKAVPAAAQAVDSRGGVFGFIRDWYAGAWQRDDEKDWTNDAVLAYSTVYACITLIAQDVGKLRPKLMELGPDGIWTETKSSAFSPVLKKPNDYQNHIQFKEWWITSKLIRGNAYALKVRDQRGVVIQLFLLDPSRVTVLVAPDGSVYYQLKRDNLSGLEEDTVVPSSEIIHDRMNCLFHPLVGISPLSACGQAANAGLKMQRNASRFFGKGSMPSGVLSAPNKISQDTADRLKAHWESEFSGDNAGAVAVLGEGLKWEPMRMTAVDSQLIEQLKWTAETVCSTFHVPPFKVGIGAMPTYPNAAEALNQIYYSDCLQSLIEAFELVMDEGLGLDEPKDGKTMGVELDIDALLRMDTGAQITSLAAGIGGALFTPNEARRKIDKPPLKGGDTIYLQQQQYGIQALFERDQDKPFSKPTPAPSGAPAAAALPTGPGEKGLSDEQTRVCAETLMREALRERDRPPAKAA